jgi:leucyl-tRNA synthetase/very-short-patch-repair endonuclease
MEYDFKEIEKKWQDEWRKRSTYKVEEDKAKKKFYVLDMFPYPSGAGLHVGHPLGYIASDIFARYKKHRGFNVLHPMGYDSFGLPAEQYAIQTGQHPAITTKNNIARYREQLDKIGFCYDWSREVRTSDPAYYKWTQWIFSLIFNSWYNKDTDKVEHINTLLKKFSENGTYNVNAAIDENWYKHVLSSGDFTFFGKDFCGEFTATDWHSMTDEQHEKILMFFRMTYLADSVVNWCPALGTVLANDEVKDGVSERGGHPVEQKLMRQWSMRISAYAERLLQGLDKIDWSESIKEVQRNWIGKSEGASVHFAIDGFSDSIEVFTTRPDTIFGVSFMTLAPEHQLVLKITTPEYKDDVEQYIAKAKLKTERDRQSDVKNVSGQFTGAHVIHPFTGEKIPVWIGEYVLAGYGTGAVMAVPAGDQRDWDFAKKYNLPIPNIFADTDISEKAEASKEAKLMNSQFLDGLAYKDATPKIISAIEEGDFGKGKINYRMRDAIFSRQRYWGEPFPVYYKNELPYIVDTSSLPIELPEVDKYLPTEDGEPPLARAKGWEYRPSAIKNISSEPHPQPLSRGEGGDSADGVASGFKKASDKNAPHPQPLSRGEGGDYVPGDDAFSNNELDTLSDAEAEYQNLYEEGGRVWQTANPKKWEFLKEHARSMRKEQTLAEKLLWERLRNNQLGIHFRRQHAIGPFIVDFANLSKKIIIEVDGGIHDRENNKEYDITRDDYLGNLGFKVFHFKNEEVLANIEDTISQISRIIPLSSGEGLGVRPSDGLGNLNNDKTSHPLEYNTMPGWAGSSWYFLRYMDANNEKKFASREKIDYWGQVDLYMGGAEHGTGHLLYSRFWTKILFDHGYIGFDEPFQKMINQGMILGRSNHVYRIMGTNKFVTSEKKDEYETQQLFVDINIIDNDILDRDAFKKWLPEYLDAEFILNDAGEYTCTFAIDKMSKRWFNVANPDDLCEKFGADTLRCYEMFLGPVEQSKPWDTKGINGVHNFLRKFWRLYHNANNELEISEEAATKAELKTLHKTIKKITEDLDRFSWNTCVSGFMICVNELQEHKCNKRSILESLAILLSPFAPHIAEEIWEKLGHKESITQAPWPQYEEAHLTEDEFSYPVSFNGKTRFFISLPVDMSAGDVEKMVLADEQSSKYLEGKAPKKVIVVPKRIVNVVV